MKIRVLDRTHCVLAESEHEDECMLCVRRVYEEGDRVEVEGSAHMFVQMDQGIPAGEVFAPTGTMTWTVPFGEHRLAYAPGIFEADRHVICARNMEHSLLSSVRNIACNPSDLRGQTDFYPHCTANVETRNEACFCARNVIDGMRLNTSHGEWPFQSWGIGAREDAWCMLDFGREVCFERVALVLRADFPLDAYWTKGHMVTSEGEEFTFDLQKTGERQWIQASGRARWLRLERLIKSDDPSAFPALIEWEVYGKDA